MAIAAIIIAGMVGLMARLLKLSPLNAWLTGCAIVPLFVFIFQLFAYYMTGKKVYSLNEPSFRPGAISGAVVTLPFPILAFCLATIPDQRHAVGIFQGLGLARSFYIFLFSRFVLGAIIQVILIKRHKNRLKPGPRELRAAS